jgi:ankyrin repeat protein
MTFDFFEQLRDDIKRGDAIALRRFIEQSGDPNLHNARGETPLGVAAAIGQTRLVELLLFAGANVNHHVNGWTPLYSAAMNGHQKTVATLLEHGADPRIPMHEKSIAYWVSFARPEYPEILELLTAHSSNDAGAA